MPNNLLCLFSVTFIVTENGGEPPYGKSVLTGNIAQVGTREFAAKVVNSGENVALKTRCIEK